MRRPRVQKWFLQEIDVLKEEERIVEKKAEKAWYKTDNFVVSKVRMWLFLLLFLLYYIMALNIDLNK